MNTFSADSLEDNSPNLLEGTFIQDDTQIGVFFSAFPFFVDSLCIVSESPGFSKSAELNGRNPGIVITAGKMADLPHERYDWGTLGSRAF